MNIKILFAIVAVLLLAGCGDVTDTVPTQKIKIGVSLALSGPGAPTSQWALNGINLALERLPENERSQIELIIENDEGKPATGMNVAQKFVAENIHYVFGPLTSGVAVPTTPYYDENKVLRMQAGAGVTNTVSTGVYRFFLLGKVEPWMRILAEYAFSHGIKTVSILYMDDEYGKDNLNWFEKYYSGQILAKEPFARGDSDFRTQLLKIKESNPDAVFIIAIGPSLLNALKQMEELGIDKQKLSLINTEDTEIVKSAGHLIEDIIYPTIADQSESEVKTWFHKQYMEKHGVPNEAIAASAFDSFNIMWAAIKECGDDIDCARTGISSTRNYVGASGIISVDAQGVGARTPAIKAVKNGKFVYID